MKVSHNTCLYSYSKLQLLLFLLEMLWVKAMIFYVLFKKSKDTLHCLHFTYLLILGRFDILHFLLERDDSSSIYQILRVEKVSALRLTLTHVNQSISADNTFFWFYYPMSLAISNHCCNLKTSDQVFVHTRESYLPHPLLPCPACEMLHLDFCNFCFLKIISVSHTALSAMLSFSFLRTVGEK